MAFYPLLESSVLKEITIDYFSYQHNKCKVAEILERFGFAMVTDVITREECVRLEQLWARAIKATIISENNGKDSKESGVAETMSLMKDGVDLLNANELPVIASQMENGFVPGCGYPHSEFSWEIRKNKVIREIYADLMETDKEELCVGTDLVFYAPKGLPKIQSVRETAHSDQNAFAPQSGTWNVFQGVLYVWDSTREESATTVVLPFSHKDNWAKMMQDQYPRSLCNVPGAVMHYIEIKNLENIILRESLLHQFKTGARRIPVPAGSLLLWNSRTMHQGWAPGTRLAQPLCWEPKVRRSYASLIRKIHCCLLGLPTTHWASLGFYHDFCLNNIYDEKSNGSSENSVSESSEARKPDIFCECVNERDGSYRKINFAYLRSFAVKSSLNISKASINKLIEEAVESEKACSTSDCNELLQLDLLEKINNLLSMLKPEIRDLL